MQYIALYELGDGKDKGVSVCFPDLPGCISVGDNFEEAVRMAHEALTGHLEVMMEDGDPIPDPRSLEQIKDEWEDWSDWTKDGNFVVGVVSAFPALKPKKCTLYIAGSLLARIDEVCANRSAFFTEAAKAVLDGKLPISVK